MHALQFNLSQPQANFWIHQLLPVLQHALGEAGLAPEREASRVAHSQLALEATPDRAIDGTERRRQRPADEALRSITAARKKPIRTRTFCWSTRRAAKWSI
jgi:hypothetical protein